MSGNIDQILGELKGFKDEVLRRFDNLEDDMDLLQKIPERCAAHSERLNRVEKDVDFLRVKVSSKADKTDLEEVKKIHSTGLSSRDQYTIWGTAIGTVLYGVYFLFKFLGLVP